MSVSKSLYLLAGVLFLLFLYNDSYAQNEKANYLKLIGDWDKDFERTDVPDKWAN